MTRIRFSDFKKMYGDASLDSLYHALLPCGKGESGGEVIAIDDAAIKGEAFRRQWAEWKQANADKLLDAPDPEIDEITNPDPAPVMQSAPAKPFATKAMLDAADQKLSHLKEAEARYLKYWVGEKGLLNSTENGVLIDAWFAANNVEYSAASIDRAVEACRAGLQFYVAPTVERIPGTQEARLPLGTKPSSKYSVRQLRDLDERERAAKAAQVRATNTELVKSLG